MQQLTQQLGSGALRVEEFPPPICGRGQILVRTHYSVISPGTEGSTVKTARKSLLGKAIERPEQIRQVLDAIAVQGPLATFRAVRKRLDAYSPMGYSCAGEVLEVGAGVSGFAVGDVVAAGGVGYANHAEMIAAPVNLCVKLQPGCNLKSAAYNTVGAIAMQGVRQADVRLGESCAVIGLGLLGQLVCVLLRAAGVRVLGIDIDPNMVEIAARHAAADSWLRNEPGLAETIVAKTGGAGADAVIITAATSSLDPINFAGRIARKRGRVVVVGAVPTGFDRDHYYRKELELRMSCSYGPGRYDPTYEEKGVDYPIGYVRWTEKRNMEAFQELIAANHISIDYLTTHEYGIERADEAYDTILSRKEPVLGVVIRYDTEKRLDGPRQIEVHDGQPGRRGIAFIGAGSYAQSQLLPNLPKNGAGGVRKVILSNNGTTSRRVAEKYGFELCTSDPADVLRNPDVSAVVIATRHESHADYTIRALNENKHVFVEKPLAINPDELQAVADAYAAARRRGFAPVFAVGFNRRFAPLARLVRAGTGGGPAAMLYRVNAGAIPDGSWIHDPEQGGGRIVGELCHFIDFMSWMAGAPPVRVFASPLLAATHGDCLNLNIDFSDGSIGAVAYYSNGCAAAGKEYFELHRNGMTASIADFKQASVRGNRVRLKERLWNQDKGQPAMMRAFTAALETGTPFEASFAEFYDTTAATFAVSASLRERRPVDVGIG